MQINIVSRCVTCGCEIFERSHEYVKTKLEPGEHPAGNGSYVVPDTDQIAIRFKAPLTCQDCGTVYCHDVIMLGDEIVTQHLTPEENAAARPGERKELLEKVRRLNEEIVETEKAKKASASSYNDTLSELKAELADTLELLKDTPDSD